MMRRYALCAAVACAVLALLWWRFGAAAAVAPVAIAAGLRVARRKAAALGESVDGARTEHHQADAAVDEDRAAARDAIVRAESAQPPADDLEPQRSVYLGGR